MSEKFDRTALFEWLEKSTSILSKNIENGIQKGQNLKRHIDKKIDSNPKAKATRDKISAFLHEKSEQIQDLHIGHTRLGNIPNAAQRLAQRQLFKLLKHVRDADPDFNWDAYMPNTNEIPIFDAFDTLSLPYGAPWEDVKKRYRKLMREYHPDKHSQTLEDEKKATEKTQQITAAYELIQQHYGK